MGAFLPQIVFRWRKPDDTPAFGYYAAFFGAGLSPIQANLKNVYSESEATVPLSQTTGLPILGVPFDVEGKMTIVLGAGAYKAVIFNELNVAIFTKDNIPGEGGFGSGFTSSIADLRNVLSFDPAFIYVAGYYAPGDGGHGMFYWDATDATADDGGYTIAPTSNPVTGRWKRIPDENGDVRAASFGFDQNTGSILTTQMQAADAYATAQGRTLRIDVGTGTAQIGAMTFSAPRVVFEGRGLKGVVAVPAVVFNSLVEGPPAFLFERMTVTLAHPYQVALPEWWNTAKDGVTDDLAKIDAMFASGAEGFRFADGDYEVSAPPTFPATGLIESFGTVTQGATVHVAIGIRALDAASNFQAGQDGIFGRNVIAGNTGPGYFQAKAGDSDDTFKAAGALFSKHASQGNTGAGEDTLTDYSFTLDGGSLKANGDRLEITYAGDIGDASNNHRTRLYIGGVLYFDSTVMVSPAPGDENFWKIHVQMFYLAGALYVTGYLINDKDTTVGKNTRWYQATLIGVDPAVDNAMIITVEAVANNDVQCLSASIDLFPT